MNSKCNFLQVQNLSYARVIMHIYLAEGLINWLFSQLGGLAKS